MFPTDRLTSIEERWSHATCGVCHGEIDILYLLETLKELQDIVARLLPLLAFPVTDCEGKLKEITLRYAKAKLELIENQSRFDMISEKTREGVSIIRQMEERGLGGLYADDLRRTGHTPWLHGSDPSSCWCNGVN